MRYAFHSELSCHWERARAFINILENTKHRGEGKGGLYKSIMELEVAVRVCALLLAFQRSRYKINVASIFFN